MSGRVVKWVPPCRLVPFEAAWAELVASWAQDAREAYWLAPRNPPPLTAAEVLRWHTPGHTPYALLEEGRATPVGYGELNRLSSGRRRYWLGHLVIDPAERGRGLGAALTRKLLEEAFVRRRAQEVSLVVFPDNVAAIACYRAAGMREDGYETHEFAAYRRVETLLRMVVRAGPRGQWP